MDPRQAVRHLSEVMTFSELVELAWTSRDPGLAGSLVVSEVFPSHLARAEVRAWIMATLEERPKDMRPGSVYPLFRRNWNRNAGAEPLKPFHGAAGVDDRVAQLERDHYQPTPTPVHPLNAVYAARFVELAESRRIAVIWLIPPMHPEVQNRRERHGRYVNDLPFLRALASRFSNLTIIDGRSAGYGPELFSDMTHLAPQGAVAFSNSLAKIVRDRPTGPGSQWVRLRPLLDGEPARLAAEFENHVEDIDESAAAFRRAAPNDGSSVFRR